MLFARILCAAALAAVPMLAQGTGSATLVGTVTDSTGAAVASAKITVVNLGTQFTSTSATNAEGNYFVPYLIPGNYRLTIELAGFKSYVRDGIELRINESPRINVQLEVGSVSESVNVSSSTPLLETETSAAGQVMEGETVIKLPVMQKGIKRMTLYMPGVNVINGLHGNGQRERAMGMTLDGVSGKEPVRGAVNDDQRIMTGTLDMIQEFKMWTTGLPAEFGHSSGGVLAAVYKSGTNTFHGSLEDRYVNGKLVHRQYFDQLKRCDVGLPCNPWTYHEMSATAGGPIYIPKIYNGKDKTFWFFGFQRHHEKVSETAITSVPTQDMYNGDFSFGGRGFPIYDPDTTRQVDGAWVRDAFPGNRIPVSRFDPVARNLISNNPWTQSNRPGVVTPTGVTQNLVLPTKGRYYFSRYDNKVDHQFSTNHRIFGRFSRMRNRAPGRYSTDIAWELYDPVLVIPNDFTNIVVSDTYTISPTLINEIRLGHNRRRETKDPVSYGQGWAQKLGIPNVDSSNFPRIITGYNGNPGGRFQNVAEDVTFQENLTKVAGRHTIKGGYELLRTRYNALVEALPAGTYNMGGTDFPFRPNTGNTFASFLLGNVASAQFTRNQATWLPRWWSHSMYVQDDFRPGRNLTLNLGLRWSYESPFSTKYGQQAQFDPTAIDPTDGRSLGAIVHRPGPLARKDLNNFQPRLGLAWNFKPKLVFRSSFTVITADLLTNGLNQNFEEYVASANVQAPPGDPRTSFKLSQGPPAINFVANQDGSVPYLGTNFGSRNATWYDPNMRSPYVMNWSGGFQYQFTNTWLIEAIYQGSAGVKLLNNWNTNVQPISFFPVSDRARTEVIRTSFQNFRPFPRFGNVDLFSNFGHNTYHAGTLRFEKRHSKGLTLNAFYTWSKTLNDADDDGTASGITYYNRRLEKARANYDIHHRMVATVTYELPFGKGRTWMNNSRIGNAIFGGWEVVWIQTFQTGPPFTVGFAGSPVNYLPGVGNRAIQLAPNDQVKLAHVDIGSNRFPFSAQKRYLDINGFTYPGEYQIGTLGRNTLEAPGVLWPQTSVQKTWRIKEALRFTLRGDVNNVFKYHNFNPPNSTYNRTDPSNFGTFSGTRGSFSDIGTGRWHTIIVGRIEW